MSNRKKEEEETEGESEDDNDNDDINDRKEETKEWVSTETINWLGRSLMNYVPFLRTVVPSASPKPKTSDFSKVLDYDELYHMKQNLQEEFEPMRSMRSNPYVSIEITKDTLSQKSIKQNFLKIGMKEGKGRYVIFDATFFGCTFINIAQADVEIVINFENKEVPKQMINFRITDDKTDYKSILSVMPFYEAQKHCLDTKEFYLKKKLMLDIVGKENPVESILKPGITATKMTHRVNYYIKEEDQFLPTRDVVVFYSSSFIGSWILSNEYEEWSNGNSVEIRKFVGKYNPKTEYLWIDQRHHKNLHEILQGIMKKIPYITSESLYITVDPKTLKLKDENKKGRIQIQLQCNITKTQDNLSRHEFAKSVKIQ